MGRKWRSAPPKDAFDLHIGMIHQHFKLVDVFTAAENIILGLPGDKGKMDKNAVAKAVREIADRYGFDIDPNQKIYEMSVSQKQTVEIVKVLYRGADILILDEPTAVLTPQETEKLFTVMRNMKKRTARRSSSSRTSCMRCLPSPTAWPFCARASTSAILTLPPLPSSR